MLRGAMRSLILYVAMLAGFAAPGYCTIVNGTVITYQGQPAAGRQVHFQNTISNDIYLTKTGPDGSFRLSLPPGNWILREEHGALIGKSFTVGTTETELGPMGIQAPLHPPKLFQMQGMGEAIIKSPAPSTANVAIFHDAPIESIKAFDVKHGIATPAPVPQPKATPISPW